VKLLTFDAQEERVKYPVVKSSHVVPRTYLRGFADENEQIAVHIVGQSDVHVMDINKAGTRSKYYARERPDGTEIHDVEWSLSQVEDRAGPLLRQVASDWPLDIQSKVDLATLFALQMLRGSRWMEFHRAFTESHVAGLGRQGEDKGELTTLEDHLLSKTAIFAEMLDAGKKLTRVIASLKWTLLEFRRPWLVTSDHPVVFWPMGVGARQPEATPQGVGFLQTLEYRVPISSERAILMTWADGPDTRAAAKKDDAASLNAFTVAEASPQWFHSPDATPPVASGLLTPLSLRFLSGYGDDVAAQSPRRARVQQLIGPLIGKNTLREAEIEVVYIAPE
jgi:hypothetical protein